ncbi:protein kinase [Streptomyces sp. AA1529]|uniref:protein kinase n=1 Tax=Streptomyces sp. AA1529 TaxID=1203257 RepID=UPI003D758E9C
MEEHAEYTGRLLADRYRLPLPPADAYELAESPAWDVASGQEVLVRQVPLPEVVEAEVVDEVHGAPGRGPDGGPRGSGPQPTRGPADPAVRRAMEAAVAAAQLPDHPRLDQIFDVFVEDDGLWIVSESVPARSLAALLAERPLGAHRAAEIAADLLAALRIVHAHGWVHRNITARTVLVCEDGRAVLTGLAVGAAEEALCGYDPLPPPLPDDPGADPGVETGVEAGSSASVPVHGGRDAHHPRGEHGGPPAPGPRREPAPGPAPAPQPATWTGERLPEGFTARDGAGPAADAPHTEERRRGIFGLEGFEPQEDVRGPQDVRGPHGGGLPDRAGPADEVSARAARRGAIAAYREGAQRAVADTRDAALRARGESESGSGSEADRPMPGADWWSTRPDAGPADHGSAHTLDDDVRWLPSAEDEVHPDELTGGGVRQVERDEIYGPYASGPYGVPPPFGRPAPGGQDPAPDAASAPYAEPGTGTVVGNGNDPDGGPGTGPNGDSATGPHRGRRSGGGSGPTALPGPRPAGTRSVPAPWTAGPSVRDQSAAPGGYAADGAGPGPAAERPAAPDETPWESGEVHHPDPEEVPWDGDAGYPAPDEAPWGGAEAVDGRYRGPATALAAERARHARTTVVGPVTERWAPEQAGPVYENWRLAPPVGPAADLWALGVLLFRCVQGHAPYPEDSAAELVQMVCAEPPAFAEDCGPLRPVVESLMRQDPTERPDFEELRGWLRSIIRSAPEPDVGLRTVTAPLSLDPGAPADPHRLPIVRRRGELVRRRWRKRTGGAARRGRGPEPPPPPEQHPAPHHAQAPPEQALHHAQVPHHEQVPHHAQAPLPAERAEPVGHRRSRRDRVPDRSPEGDPGGSTPDPGPDRNPGPDRRRGSGPRRLGVLVLTLILLGMAAAVAFVAWFLPGGEQGEDNQRGSVVVPEEREPGPSPGRTRDGGSDDGAGKSDRGGQDGKDDRGAGSSAPATGPEAPDGYRISRDPAGFRIAVPKEWDRRSANGRGQVRYNGGEVEMVVVNGRDTTGKFGKDPMAYQSEDEPELSAYRAADWASTGGLRRIDVGDRAMAEGTFSWREPGGRQVYARNRAMIVDGRYHLLLVLGSKGHKAEVDRHFEAVVDTYRPTAAR